jgi:hypothetical protein
MRSTDLLNWSELQSEHFQLRTGRSVLAAVKRHFESCKYEPIVHDGKPQAVRTSAEIKSVRRGRK